MSEEEDKSCCPNTYCEGKCFDDKKFFTNIINFVCFDGYCQDIECFKWVTQHQASFINYDPSASFFSKCFGCCIVFFCNTPQFFLILLTCLNSFLFLLFFMPPMIIVLLQTRMMGPKRYHTFDWFEKEEIRADTTDDVRF